MRWLYVDTDTYKTKTGENNKGDWTTSLFFSVWSFVVVVDSLSVDCPLFFSPQLPLCLTPLLTTLPLPSSLSFTPYTSSSQATLWGCHSLSCVVCLIHSFSHSFTFHTPPLITMATTTTTAWDAVLNIQELQDMIRNRLSLEDLKACTLVSRQWNRYTFSYCESKTYPLTRISFV